MNRTDVGDVCVFPTVVIDDRPRGIEPASSAYHSFNERILPRVLLAQLRKAHAFVHWHPRDDARMVVIASHGALPFGRQLFFRFERPLARVGHLFPNQHAHTVTPVKPPRVLDLLVFANAVETKRLGPTDIGLRCLIRRRGEITLRPIDRKSTRLNSSHVALSRMPSSA